MSVDTYRCTYFHMINNQDAYNNNKQFELISILKDCIFGPSWKHFQAQ